MGRTSWVLLFLLEIPVLLPRDCLAHTWYLSNSGNDRASGSSRAHPWKTISRLEVTSFGPGDTILFRGGDRFSGTLKVGPFIPNRPEHSLVLGSYGNGRAIINGGDGDAIFAHNAPGLVVRDLILEGSGIATNRGSGLDCYSDDSLREISNLRIVHCMAHGFRNFGFVFWTPASAAVRGFRHVRILGCEASGNGEAGIASFAGYQAGFVHRDFYLSGCRVHDNPGIREQTSRHSGNGIVLGSVDQVVITHCEAWNNGRDNTCDAGGPVGIWVWLCHGARIDHCISHDNHTSSLKDGGGFDIDGGSSDCLVQYNYSYGNDGAGYLLAEYGAVLPFRDNLIRYNISLDDGRKNGYGGITLWSADSLFQVTQSRVSHNLILCGPVSREQSRASALLLMGAHFSGVRICDNVFLSWGGSLLVGGDLPVDTGKAWFTCNYYQGWGKADSLVRWEGKPFSLEDWVRDFHQEMGRVDAATWFSGREVHFPKEYSGTFPPELLGSHPRPLRCPGGCPAAFPAGMAPASNDYFGRPISGRRDFIGISPW
ncbi:MAG TPA: right-handed parallel beta-helix repeat-containing protein [Chitinophagaceae bacterium]|nr:right-handed parallel beta-helix repeat-containing protein [Chitinophagaceae bacterium]